MNDEGDVLSNFIPTTNITLKSIIIPIFRKVLHHVTQGFAIMNWAENQSNHY